MWALYFGLGKEKCHIVYNEHWATKKYVLNITVEDVSQPFKNFAISTTDLKQFLEGKNILPRRRGATECINHKQKVFVWKYDDVKECSRAEDDFLPCQITA